MWYLEILCSIKAFRDGSIKKREYSGVTGRLNVQELKVSRGIYVEVSKEGGKRLKI